MHNVPASQTLFLCFACCLILQLAAGATLLLGRQYAPMKRARGVICTFAFKALLALPGIAVVGLWMEKMNVTPFHPSLFLLLGAASSCIFLDLFIHLDQAS